MTACWVLHSRLTYFCRNLNFSRIFYFSKSTSINTQHSSLWDTLKMMLFTKYLIKWKRIVRISWKFQYRSNLKSSIELDIQREILYLSNAPLSSLARVEQTSSSGLLAKFIFLVRLFLGASLSFFFLNVYSIQFQEIVNLNASQIIFGLQCFCYKLILKSSILSLIDFIKSVSLRKLLHFSFQ